MGEPQAQSQAPASDPYAAFGGSISQIPTPASAAPPHPVTAPAAPAAVPAASGGHGAGGSWDTVPVAPATPTSPVTAPATAPATDPYAAFGGSVNPGTSPSSTNPAAAQPEQKGTLGVLGDVLHKMYDYSPMGWTSSAINWTHQQAADTAQGIADNMARLADAGQLTPARKAIMEAAQYEAGNLRGITGAVQGALSPQAAALLGITLIPGGGTLVGLGMLAHGGYNAVKGWGDMIVPDQPGHQTPWYNRIAPDATEHELQSLAEATGGAAQVGEGINAFKARATANAAAKTRAQSLENAENFKKAVPQSAAAPYEVKDYLAAEKYLQHQHASEAITGVPRTVEAADDALGDIEGHLQKYIQKAPHDLINADPLAVTRVQLGKSMDNTFVAQGMKDLQRFDLNPQNLTLERADKIRWQMNQEMKGILKTNDYDVATARATNPQFAALENASEALREGVYNRLAQPDIGLPEAQSLRADEGSIIKIRNAAQRQIFKGGAVVPSSVNPSSLRNIGANVAKAAGTGGGALVGGTLGSAAGPIGTAGGATAGALVGREVGEAAARYVRPNPLTKDQMLARIFNETPPVAQPTPGTAEARAASVPVRTPGARAAAAAPPAGTGPTVPPAAAGAPGVVTPAPTGTPVAPAVAPAATVTAPVTAPAPVNPVAAAAATGQPAIIARVAAPAEVVAPTVEEPLSTPESRYSDFLNKTAQRLGQEAAGQGVLDDMEEKGISPRDVSQQFWNKTYFDLPAAAQVKFQNYLKSLTGFKPGDTIGTDAAGQPIVAQDWNHIASDILDLSDNPTHLEGGDRGLVAAMKAANDRFSGVTKPKPTVTPKPVVTGRVATPEEAAAAATGKGVEITHAGDANGANEVKLKVDGDDKGYLVFNHNGSTASVVSTQIMDEADRGKGYGQQMLTEAAKKAKMQGSKALTSDENGEMTEDAKRPWESLIRKGQPVERITLPNGKPGYSWDLTKIDENAKPIPEEEEKAPEPKPAKPGTAVIGGKTVKAAPNSPAEIAAGTAQRRAAGATTATAAAMLPTQPAVPEKTEEAASVAQPSVAAAPAWNKDELRALVTKHAQQENLRPGLYEAQIQQESGYNPQAISHVGAKGLAQFTDKTAEQYGLDDPFDAEKSAAAGAMYMRDLLDRFNGDERKALAAYDAGPTNIRNLVHEFGADWLSHAPNETQHYVRAIEANAPHDAERAHVPYFPGAEAHPTRSHEAEGEGVAQ